MSNLIGSPHIEVESHNGIWEINIYTKHLSNRRIFLNGTIDNDLVNNIVAQLLYLHEEADSPIFLYINSPGGEVYAGLYLYDVLQSITIPVYTFCAGIAASMTAFSWWTKRVSFYPYSFNNNDTRPPPFGWCWWFCNLNT